MSFGLFKELHKVRCYTFTFTPYAKDVGIKIKKLIFDKEFSALPVEEFAKCLKTIEPYSVIYTI